MATVTVPSRSDFWDIAYTAARVNGGKVKVKVDERKVNLDFTSENAASWFNKMVNLMVRD